MLLYKSTKDCNGQLSWLYSKEKVSILRAGKNRTTYSCLLDRNSMAENVLGGKAGYTYIHIDSCLKFAWYLLMPTLYTEADIF